MVAKWIKTTINISMPQSPTTYPFLPKNVFDVLELTQSVQLSVDPGQEVVRSLQPFCGHSPHFLCGGIQQPLSLVARILHGIGRQERFWG